jgi:hypothetical protein
MTWCNEYRATPGFFLASSAICCRFVYRFAGFSVPSHVSRQQFSSKASPFSPAGPIDLVPRLRRYYGDATQSWIAHRSLMISRSGSRASLTRFVLSLMRSRWTGGGPFGPGAFRCRRPPFRLFHADNTGLLRFPADPFMPLPCSKIPAGSKRPRQNGLSDTAPAPNKAKAPTNT